MSLHGTETWTLRKVDQKCLESVEMWCWWRIEIISTDNVRNEIIYRVKEEEKLTGWVTSCLVTTF
jgi:hypothetical protein